MVTKTCVKKNIGCDTLRSNMEHPHTNQEKEISEYATSSPGPYLNVTKGHGDEVAEYGERRIILTALGNTNPTLRSKVHAQYSTCFLNNLI